MDNFATKLINLNLKVDSMEVMLELAIVGVLNEVFGIEDVSPFCDQLFMQVDETQGYEATFYSQEANEQETPEESPRKEMVGNRYHFP